MKVIFAKSDDGRRCSWRAELPGHRRLRGSTMAARSVGTDLPHDLAQFVVEAGLRSEHGFWNLVANGATFQSIGRRLTRPGRQLIAAYRAELNEVEAVANGQVQAWRDGQATPVGPELDAMQARWRALGPGDELTVEWPTRRLAKPPSRDRRVPPGDGASEAEMEVRRLPHRPRPARGRPRAVAGKCRDLRRHTAYHRRCDCLRGVHRPSPGCALRPVGSMPCRHRVLHRAGG